ncbi:MAG: endonuclease/exonuclease/phosphatase family protein [Luteolibacter sp.]
MLRPPHQSFFKHAPVFIGAAFCTATLLLTACERREPPEWEFPPETTTSAGTETSRAQPPVSPESWRLLSYNLKNWLTMERGGQPASKPEAEKHAAVRLIAHHRPDVLGVCEIGTPADLADLRERLAAHGLDLPHFVHHGGADPVRHLGLLSRFPVIRTDKAPQTTYQLSGTTHGIQRGILDATLQIGSDRYRLLGVHLKSRLDTPGADQAHMRLEEARLLRTHIGAILRDAPATRLIVYGDFNDTRDSTTFHTVNAALHCLPLKDQRSETWTYRWTVPETYSRIDFVFTAPALKASFDPGNSRVIDDSEWSLASDHRPLLVTFRYFEPFE